MTRPLRAFLGGLLIVVVFVWAVGLMLSSPELGAVEWAVNYWPQLLVQAALLVAAWWLLKKEDSDGTTK